MSLECRFTSDIQKNIDNPQISNLQSDYILIVNNNLDTAIPSMILSHKFALNSMDRAKSEIGLPAIFLDSLSLIRARCGLQRSDMNQPMLSAPLVKTTAYVIDKGSR